jgi:type IX secretion system PorP/SprF family membrane protein
MRKLLFLFFCGCVALTTKAQDPNFSQFFASPLTLNPALTGKFDGTFRVAGNYRNQWPTINNAFTTATISVDGSILRNVIPEFDKFGVGVMGFTDKSGNGVLQTNYLALSTSYHKSLDENGFHQIGLGFQGTYVNKRLDVNSKVCFVQTGLQV